MNRKQKIHIKPGQIVVHIVIIILLFLVLFPFYVLIVNSFKLPKDILINPLSFPGTAEVPIVLGAYGKAWGYIKNYLWNSVVLAFFEIAGVLSIASFAAYGFAKVDFFLKKPIYGILISSLTLPNCVGMIASVIIFDGIGWMGTPLPLMIPKMMGQVGIVFFLRQFYMSLPDDMIGAARVDGLDDYGIFFRIALPLSLPAIGSQFILTFISAYNDYLGPLYYLLGYPEIYPLQLSLAYLRTASNADWSLLMAGTMVATVPMVCLYLLSQKFILKGVSITSGLKG